MTFTELQTRATALAAFEGWADQSPAPDYAYFVNQAYREFAASAETTRDNEEIATVSGTAEYTTAKSWLKLFNAVYDTASAKSPVRPSSEAYEAMLNPSWREQSGGTPVRFVRVAMNKIALVPPPNAVKTLRIYGVRQPTAMSSGSDVPDSIPDAYHEAIANRAAYLIGKQFAEGDAIARLQDYEMKYQQAVQACRAAIGGSWRRAEVIE